MKAGGSVIEPGPPRRGVPRPRAGRRPEILVRRAAHSPRSRRLQQEPIPQRRARLVLEPRVRVCDTRRNPRAPPRFVQREAQLPAFHLPARRKPVPCRIFRRFHRRIPLFRRVLGRQKHKARRSFGSPGFAGEFTLMDRDLFRCSPGEGPDRGVQSIGAVHEARTERQALGRLFDVGDSHHFVSRKNSR
jgi:hypothetical protein